MRTFKPEIDVRRWTETSVRPYSGADHPYAAEIALAEWLYDGEEQTRAELMAAAIVDALDAEGVR